MLRKLVRIFYSSQILPFSCQIRWRSRAAVDWIGRFFGSKGPGSRNSATPRKLLRLKRVKWSRLKISGRDQLRPSHSARRRTTTPTFFTWFSCNFQFPKNKPIRWGLLGGIMKRNAGIRRHSVSTSLHPLITIAH